MTLLMGNTYHARNIVASVFVMVWAARLAGMPTVFLNHQNNALTRFLSTFVGFLLFRVLKTGSDARFNDIRSHFFKFMGT